jgi:hypothetical protein
MTEEDEAFNEIERRSRAKKEAVKATIAINPYRDLVIEEVAQHVEKISPIVAGYLAMYIRKDLANYIREMKK